jgi:hypothetical protein
MTLDELRSWRKEVVMARALVLRPSAKINLMLRDRAAPV